MDARTYSPLPRTNQRPRLRLVLLLTLVTAAASCARLDEAKSMAAPAAPPADEAYLVQSAAAGDAFSEDDSQLPAERMVIKTAGMAIETSTPDDTAQKARKLVESIGGYVVSSETSVYANNANTITISARIPSAQFDTTIAAIGDLGEQKRLSVSGQDVTEEFVDVQARLRNQKQLEERFLSLLQSAATVTDTVEIERELARVRTTIDQLEGRSKFLKDQVAMSTIDLSVEPAPTLFANAGPSLLDEVVDAFSDAGELIVAVIGGIIRVAGALFPIAVLAALFGLTARALYRRKKRAIGPR